MSFLGTISVLLLCWNWKKGGLLAIIICMVIVVLAQYHSPVFVRKLDRTIIDIKEFTNDLFNQTDSFQSRDRLMLWKEIFPSICKEPVWGYGMERGRNEVLSQISSKRVDPHNEFINITLEFGLVGLILFLSWLLFFFNSFRNNILPWKYLGLFIATAMIIDCMYNGALSYNRESHLFCILIAVLYVTDQTKNRFG
jgi:O-antigen ligase